MPPLLTPQSAWKRGAVSAVILFHLIAVPLGSYWTQTRDTSNALKRLFGNYVYGMRIRQYWSLFSPEPRRHAVQYSALITFKNGETKKWRRPYPPNWNFFERHLAYGFQKWDLVSNNLDFKSGLWDSLAHYLLTIYRDENNPVVKISFIRSFAPWPPPRLTGYVGGEEADLKWTDRVLFNFDALKQQFL